MYFVRLFVLACVDIPQTHNYCVHEFTYNAAALVESVSPMFMSLLIAQLSWLEVFHSFLPLELLVHFWKAQLTKTITKYIHSPVQYIHGQCSLYS